MSSLPVLTPEPKIRRSRNGRRRALVLLAVHGLIGAHIAHWLIAGRTLTPVEPSEAMAFARGGVINAGLIFFAVAVVSTAVLGRFFCGWGCHLVALQDLCRWLLLRVGIRPRPLRSRALRLVPPVAFVYMFLWPLAYRIWIDDPLSRTGLELTTEDFWATFPGWAVGVLTFLVCGFVVVYLLGAKGFCTYACPYGALFGAADRLAPWRIRVTDACEGCGHCTAVCSSNIRVHEEVRDWGMVVSSGCMKCQDCVAACPNDALYYGRGPIPLLAEPRTEGAPRTRSAPSGERLRLWEELVLATAFLGAFLAFRGLYGLVPFLLALGLGVVFAFLMLTAVRLGSRPHLSLRRRRLKWRGRLQPTGRLFVAATVLLGAFWLHSAAVRGSAFLGLREARSLGPQLASALDVTAPAPSLTQQERRRVERARVRLDRALRWGLVPTPGLTAELATLDLLAGDLAAFALHAKRATELDEQDADLLRAIAREAWERGDLATATAAYELAIARWPRWDRPYTDLAVVTARAGELDRAAEILETGLRQAGATADLTYNLGVVRAIQGDARAAAGLFAETLQLDPDHLQARENLEAAEAMGLFPEPPPSLP